MDELREYLNRSKTKRYASVKKAQKILDQYKRDNSSRLRGCDNAFPSVTQKNFKRYEQNLAIQLREIFYPCSLKDLDSFKNQTSRSKINPYGAVYLTSPSTNFNSSSRSRLHQSHLMQDLQRRIENRSKEKRVKKVLDFQSKLNEKNKSLDKLH